MTDWRETVWKFQIKLVNSVFSSVQVSLKESSISVFFAKDGLSEHALRIKGALNIHKCPLATDNPS